MKLLLVVMLRAAIADLHHDLEASQVFTDTDGPFED